MMPDPGQQARSHLLHCTAFYFNFWPLGRWSVRRGGLLTKECNMTSDFEAASQRAGHTACFGPRQVVGGCSEGFFVGLVWLWLEVCSFLPHSRCRVIQKPGKQLLEIHLHRVYPIARHLAEKTSFQPPKGQIVSR